MQRDRGDVLSQNGAAHSRFLGCFCFFRFGVYGLGLRVQGAENGECGVEEFIGATPQGWVHGANIHLSLSLSFALPPSHKKCLRLFEVLDFGFGVSCSV